MRKQRSNRGDHSSATGNRRRYQKPISNIQLTDSPQEVLLVSSTSTRPIEERPFRHITNESLRERLSQRSSRYYSPEESMRPKYEDAKVSYSFSSEEN